jgi:hypothetical protein
MQFERRSKPVLPRRVTHDSRLGAEVWHFSGKVWHLCSALVHFALEFFGDTAHLDGEVCTPRIKPRHLDRPADGSLRTRKWRRFCVAGLLSKLMARWPEISVSLVLNW